MAKKSTVTRIALEGELSIFTAAAQRQCLLDAFGTGKDVEVDLSGVGEVDSAGVQLLLAAKCEAEVHKKCLSFAGHSPAVIDILELCDLAEQLDARTDRVPDEKRKMP